MNLISNKRRPALFTIAFLLICFGVGVMLVTRFSKPQADLQDSSLQSVIDNSSLTIPTNRSKQEAPKQEIQTVGDGYTLAETNPPELFKTEVDHTGQYVSANLERSVVTLRDKNNRVLWSTNVIMGLENEPRTHLLNVSRG